MQDLYMKNSMIRHVGRSMLLILLLGTLLSVPGFALAQEELPEDVQVTVSQLDVSQYPEITIYVNVTDEAGNPLQMLDQSNINLTEDGQPVEIVDFAGEGEERPVDVVFVFDTTGSMGEEISAMIDTSIAFAEELKDRGRDYRLGLVTFGDEIRGVYNPDNTLTPDSVVFQDWMRTLIAEGGGENPENDYGALKQAAQMQFRPDAQVIFVLITDSDIQHYGDPPDEGHTFDDPDLNLEPILAMLSERAITAYVVGPNISEMLSLAEQTSGTYYDITANPDFTRMIEEIGATIANQYRITYHSPRPTYDGTRRDVRVSIGTAEAGIEYMETHLLNLQSDWLIGAVCLLPMLAMLAVPPLVQLVQRSFKPAATPSLMTTNIGSGASVIPEPPPYVPPAPPTSQQGSDAPAACLPATCPHCGKAMRPGAQFCAKCGQSLGPPAPPRLSGPQPPKAAPTVLELLPPPAGLPESQPPAPPQAGGLPTQYSPEPKPPPRPASSSPTTCPKCGRQLRPGARFCPGCGNHI
jgi:hypothetical protein